MTTDSGGNQVSDKPRPTRVVSVSGLSQRVPADPELTVSEQPKETCGTCGESTWSRSLSGVAYCAHCGANFTATCQRPASPEPFDHNHTPNQRGCCEVCGKHDSDPTYWTVACSGQEGAPYLINLEEQYRRALQINSVAAYERGFADGKASPQGKNHAEVASELVERCQSTNTNMGTKRQCRLEADHGDYHTNDGFRWTDEYSDEAKAGRMRPPSPEPAQEVSFNKIDEAFEAAAAQDGFCLTPREAFREGASWMASQQAAEIAEAIADVGRLRVERDEAYKLAGEREREAHNALGERNEARQELEATTDPREATDVEAAFEHFLNEQPWDSATKVVARTSGTRLVFRAGWNAHPTQIDIAERVDDEPPADAQRCHHCQGNGQLMRELRGQLKPEDFEAWAYFVFCGSCGAQGGWSKNIAGAWRFWNMRWPRTPALDTSPLLALAEKWEREADKIRAIDGTGRPVRAAKVLDARASELRAVAATLSPARDSFTEGLIAARNTQCEWCAKGLRLHEYAKGYFRHYSVDNAPVECGALKIVELLKAGPTLSPVTERQREILRLADEVRSASQLYVATSKAKPYSFADCTEASDGHFRAQAAYLAAALADERDATLVTTE